MLNESFVQGPTYDLLGLLSTASEKSQCQSAFSDDAQFYLGITTKVLKI